MTLGQWFVVVMWGGAGLLFLHNERLEAGLLALILSNLWLMFFHQRGR